MKDHQLGAEFELGAKGSLRLEADGDLYLRCRNAWNELAGDSGHVTVKFQLQGHEPPLCEADGKGDKSAADDLPFGLGRQTIEALDICRTSDLWHASMHPPTLRSANRAGERSATSCRTCSAARCSASC